MQYRLRSQVGEYRWFRALASPLRNADASITKWFGTSTDIQDINYIEVVDGVKEGDQVITGPYSIVSKTLKGGQRVKVVPKDKLFEEKKN